jgi:hypothetical protein
MKKIYLSIIGMLFISSMVMAQTTDNASDDFKPSGSPIVTIFSDFSSITSGSYTNTKGANVSSATNNTFELSRAYFGYAYNFSPDFSAKVLFDVANSSTATPSNFDAYIKNAYVEYHDNLFTVDFGMIGCTMFNLQESTWGKRYLYKSFQDQYSFGNSADLGVMAKVQFIPHLLSLDLSLTNGEGYKSVQLDSTFRLAVGLTVNPIKELTIRAYYDYYKRANEPATTADQNTFNAFASYKNKDFTLAAEYDQANGFGRVINKNTSGCSIYGTWFAAKWINVFARFDDITSNTLAGQTTEWQSTKDGQTYIAGVEFVPVKGVQIAPNFRYFNPAVKNAVASTTTVAVNVGLNF